MLQADLIVKEVQTPHGRWCRSGHTAPELFRREGAGSEPLPTRFFRVSGKNVSNVDGTYCEPCLIIANAQARQKKKDEDRIIWPKTPKIAL